MFKPYPYDDTTAVNRPPLTEETVKAVRAGNDAVVKAIAEKILAVPGNGLVAFDGYIGSDWSRTLAMLSKQLAAKNVKMSIRNVADCYKSSDELEKMLAEYLPMDRDIDPVLLFGKIFHGSFANLFDAAKVETLKSELQRRKSAGGEREVCCIVGCGSIFPALKDLYDVKVYFDLTPLQTALRVRAGKIKPLGDALDRSVNAIFRRLYYFDYELAVPHRERLLNAGDLDFYVDANQPDNLKLVPMEEFRTILDETVKSPFRCKPVYLEGVWGGFYIKKLRHLPADMKNCAWVFDLIPNEVSLLVKTGKTTLEIPFPTFFRAEAEALMGPESVRRFGAIFPIRFNYDDTYAGGGNMSVQVHPPAEYAKEHFGEPFQQDESYYVVETAGSRTYLGLQDAADVEEFFSLIRSAETEHVPFDYEKYVNYFESKKGDQFLLPGGTLHASGWNQVVLEIGSCTVGSYTFKMYDYLRLDLDGVPRPIHSKHGMNVLNKLCRRGAIDGVLRPKPKTLREGPGWKEVLLGEHEKIFFSLHRLEFECSIQDDTQGKFHVLVLVEGEEILVYSLDNPEHFYRQKYCNMVVVPASMGRYGILNLGDTPCKVTKTMLK